MPAPRGPALYLAAALTVMQVPLQPHVQFRPTDFSPDNAHNLHTCVLDPLVMKGYDV